MCVRVWQDSWYVDSFSASNLPPCTQGDVQMAVSMLLVLGEQGKSLVDTRDHAPPNSAKLAAGEVIQFLTMYFGELQHSGAHF